MEPVKRSMDSGKTTTKKLNKKYRSKKETEVNSLLYLSFPEACYCRKERDD